MSNPNHIADSLRNDFYKYPALIPTMPWRDRIPPYSPAKLKAKKHQQGITLSWQTPAKAIDGDTAYYYIIYRFDKNEQLNTEDPRNILAFHRDNTPAFIDNTVAPGKKYIYVVTALDRLHNESIRNGQVKKKARRKVVLEK